MKANEFVIEMGDKPGELAKICDILGRNQVNIKAITTDRQGGQTFLRILVDKNDKAREALEAKDSIFTENEVIVKTLIDKPNALMEVARKLGAAGVNIDAIYILNKGGDKVNVVFALDNPQKGADILKD